MSTQSVRPGTEITPAMLHARSSFELQFALKAIQPSSITAWEELKCVGYHPQQRRLEAVVDLKQSSGYLGNLCAASSREYVRFYVDFQDGGGFRDLGVSSFKASDISEAPPGPQHPLSYLVYLYIDDTQYRRFTRCNQAVIPRVRAILSWNHIPPPNSPNWTPHYGNRRDVHVQLQRRPFIILKDLVPLDITTKFPKVISPELQIPLPDPAPIAAAELHAMNLKAEVPDHRTFFATVGASVHSSMSFAEAASGFSVSEVAALKVDLTKLVDLLSTLPNPHNANVTFEELTCVGLNPETDTLGAVVHIKKTNGYSGDLCHTGSKEHVAFWADWNNNGIFDEYLGTVSFETHDIANMPADGLYYNVALPINVARRLRPCNTPYVIRVRAVLSWEALPSTTNPNQLNTWGNSRDAVVQLRPGRGSGLHTVISLVGNADRLQISPVTHLFNYSAVTPTINHNRPWGGVVNFCGIIDRNGFNGVIKYRIQFKPFGAPDSAYLPVSQSESFGRWIPPALPTYVSQTADADGWYVYDVNPALGIYSIFDNNLLSNWNASAVPDGTYTIRFEYTDELGNPVTGDQFSIVINNLPMTVSATANATVDLTKTLDLVIDGGDCHSYGKMDPIINGHVRAVHPYFAWWELDLQPTSHTHGVTPIPISRTYSSIGDTGDANAPWTLETVALDPCGYTISASGRTRVILNSSPGYFPYYGPKAVGFAKQA